jgi:hypothetical protein
MPHRWASLVTVFFVVANMGLVLGATCNGLYVLALVSVVVDRHLWLLFTLADDDVGRKYVVWKPRQGFRIIVGYEQ